MKKTGFQMKKVFDSVFTQWYDVRCIIVCNYVLWG